MKISLSLSSILLCGILLATDILQATPVKVYNLTPYPMWAGLYRTKNHTKLYKDIKTGQYETPNGPVPLSDIRLLLLPPGASTSFLNFDFELRNLIGIHRDLFFSRSEKKLAKALLSGNLKTSPTMGYVNVGGTKSHIFIGLDKRTRAPKAYSSQKEALDSSGTNLEQLATLAQGIEVQGSTAGVVGSTGNQDFRTLNEQAQKFEAQKRAPKKAVR